jgi:hypothetical protein
MFQFILGNIFDIDLELSLDSLRQGHFLRQFAKVAVSPGFELGVGVFECLDVMSLVLAVYDTLRADAVLQAVKAVVVQLLVMLRAHLPPRLGHYRHAHAPLGTHHELLGLLEAVVRPLAASEVTLKEVGLACGPHEGLDCGADHHRLADRRHPARHYLLQLLHGLRVQQRVDLADHAPEVVLAVH